MEAIENQVFESEVVLLDGRSFIHCTLSNCELRYSGGDFRMVDTLVSGCRWAFGGPARRTMEVLRMFDVLEERVEGVEAQSSAPSCSSLIN